MSVQERAFYFSFKTALTYFSSAQKINCPSLDRYTEEFSRMPRSYRRNTLHSIDDFIELTREDVNSDGSVKDKNHLSALKHMRKHFSLYC